MKEEICGECSRIIGVAEQAFVYEGRIVCEQCDKKLRHQARQDQELRDTWKPEEVAELRESEELREPEELQEPGEVEELQKTEDIPEPEEPKEILEDTEIVESQETQESEEFAEL